MKGDTISYRYFIAEGPEAEAIADAANIERDAHYARIGACATRYGADCTWGGRHFPPVALGFAHEGIDKPPMKEGFLEPKIERSGKEQYAVYYPDKRYKEGKAIREDLNAVGNFNFSEYVTGKLGVNVACFGHQRGPHGPHHFGGGTVRQGAGNPVAT